MRESSHAIGANRVFRAKGGQWKLKHKLELAGGWRLAALNNQNIQDPIIYQP
jgi:hypothetical protein